MSEEPSSSLDETVKQSIQHSYRRWLSAHNFKPRYGQRLMIAAIANALAGNTESSERLCVVEAGTGIGKTVAYLLAAAPLAMAERKTLVISTATVALQEQLLNKDLPDLVENAGLAINYSLAKGRGRYVCLSRLDAILNSGEPDQQAGLLYPDEENPSHSAGDAMQVYQSMSEAFLRGDWNGDRDDWPDAIVEKDWRLLTSDRSQCHNRRCSWVSDCSFFKARDRLQEVDCIITNHDLVLADLALGGGAILPEPEDCIFVFDEAHHLADKAVQHFSPSLRVNASQRWLQQLPKITDSLRKQWDGASRLTNGLQQVDSLSAIALQLMQPLPEQLHEYYEALNAGDEFARRRTHARFALEDLPAELLDLAVELQEQFESLAHHLAAVSDAMQKELEAEPAQQLLEQWLPVLGLAANRAASAVALFASYAKQASRIPRAHWLSRTESDLGVEYGLHSAPLLGAEYLKELLWERCYAAVLTSATLTALGRFDRLQMHTGLPAEASYSVVPSPFDYAKRAVLSVPAAATNPTDTEQHTEAVQRFIENLSEAHGVLVLFMSRKQMLDVYENLSGELLSSVLLQDQRSKQALLSEHQRRVDAGECSIIFGLASFAEGVDLPGDYCRHVVIAKLPFSVPDEPVSAALNEWVSQQGRNAFMEISVPDAALRLVQACGRLLRSEHDSGTVTILDRRLIEKRYGQDLLNALPPFKRDIGS